MPAAPIFLFARRSGLADTVVESEGPRGTALTSSRLLKKSPRLRDQIIGRGFFHSWLGCAADS